MKHVFIINSHTTFLTAYGTVNYLGLNDADVIFVYIRNFKTPDNIVLNWVCVDQSIIFSKYSNRQLSYKRKIRNIFISVIDDFIDKKIGQKYYLYSPHYAHPLFQAYYTNPLCVLGNYIQEGAIPFKDAYIVSPTLFLKVASWLFNKLYLRTERIWRPHAWYYKGTLYKQSVINSFSISNHFFKYLPSYNHIINWPEIPTNIEFEANSVIFIFDGFVNNNYIEENYYLDCCERMIQKESSSINYLRFHPAQSSEECKIIEGYFKKMSLNYKIIDISIPFECVINLQNRLKIVGMGSSLLFFAHDLKHEVVCYDRWLCNSPKYRRYKNKAGFLYFDEYKQLT